MRHAKTLVSLLLVSVFAGISSFAQTTAKYPGEWEAYTRGGYFFSIQSEKNTRKVDEQAFVEQLLSRARSEVARQLKITVRDEADLTTRSENGVSDIIYRASSNFSTDVTLRYVEVRSSYDRKRKEGHAIAYISKAYLDEVYAARALKVCAMLESAERAREEGKMDVALKYNYWAMVLQYTLPEEKQAVYEGLPVQVLARTRIEEILSALEFRFLGYSTEDPLVGRLDVSCGGKAVSSLDYSYNDGLGESSSMQVRDGVGIVEFRSGIDTYSIDITVEYVYADEADSDPEMKLALSEVETIRFPDALKRSVSVRKDPPRPGKKNKKKKKKDVETETRPASQTLSEEISAGFGGLKASEVPDGVRYEQAVSAVLDAVSNHRYDDCREAFTEEGYSVFDRLVRYGNARVLGRDGLKCLAFDGTVYCRSIPMMFSFATNGKSFLENVVFSFNEAGLIDNLAFALEAETVRDILDKTQWEEGAKISLINFLENYRTAFALENLDYISSIFSEDALIIVGKVVRKTSGDGGIRMEQEDIEYNRYTKAAYMSQLRRCFASKEYINLKFSNVSVLKTTQGTKENLYGIQLKQDYYSSSYGDTGYLYLLVDMEDSRRPLIYVRTWQPQPDADFGLYDISRL